MSAILWAVGHFFVQSYILKTFHCLHLIYISRLEKAGNRIPFLLFCLSLLSTPMLDLLVQVTTAHKMSPGSHYLQPYEENGLPLPYKPSTPIGNIAALKLLRVGVALSIPQV